MYSVCIKFRIDSNRRSIVRRFDDVLAAVAYIDDCFISWNIRVAFLYHNDVHWRTYMCAPGLKVEQCRALRAQLLSSDLSDNYVTLQKN